jgi:hypothetical protein
MELFAGYDLNLEVERSWVPVGPKTGNRNYDPIIEENLF